jgi:hypothetical protein
MATILELLDCAIDAASAIEDVGIEVKGRARELTDDARGLVGRAIYLHDAVARARTVIDRTDGMVGKKPGTVEFLTKLFLSSSSSSTTRDKDER